MAVVPLKVLICLSCLVRTVYTNEKTLSYDKTIESSLLFFNKLNNANLTARQYCERHNMTNADKYYNFIFGFSSGHVGTKGFSYAPLYGSSPNVRVRFGFEGEFSGVSGKRFITTFKWKSYTFADDYKWVKRTFLPFLQNQSLGRPTVFDLGHHTLYFYKALVKYLVEETNFSFVFVRIRRERYETALSLTYGAENVPLNSLCDQLMIRFCPHDRTEDVINKVSRDIWENFTNFQQALWMIDEIEARWQLLIKQYRRPKMEYLEVFWGKCWPDSFSEAATKIGKLIGITVPVNKEHAQQHRQGGHVVTNSSSSSIGSYNNISIDNFILQDNDYKRLMGFL